MSYVHAFPMHTYLIVNIFDIIDIAWDFFDCSSLFLPLNLFTLVMSMAPKCKSTLARNPLSYSASSSTKPFPSNIGFHDDVAFKAFSENFSRRGIHSKRQVILSDFADTEGKSKSLLQYARDRSFSTSLFHSHSRYMHPCHIAAGHEYASCP